MATSMPPDPLTRRDLIERELDPAKALRIAEAYLEEDRGLEAVAFLRKAEARERLEALRDEAVSRGDSFLLREVAAALGETPSAERWRALAAAAREAGKLEYAADAEQQYEREQGD